MVRKMKKILFVINQLGGGGAERVLTLLANDFSKKNDVDILAIHRTKNKYEISDDVRVVELDGCEESTFKIIGMIRKVTKQEKPDVIISFEYHMNMKVLLAVAGIKNVKVIVSERNDPAQKGGKLGYKQLRNWLYKKADYLVCQTPDAKAYFPQNIQKKAVIIPNPIKKDLPQPWGGERKKQIVNFCRLVKQKNLPLLIDAFEEFYQTHLDYALMIYGDGEERDNLEKYIRTKGLETVVTLHPAVQNVHDKIKDAMMFVSSSDYEGLSNSMIEAMAIGLPTICTDCPCGGARMVIKNGENGVLVSVGEKTQMVLAMSRMAEQSEWREKLSQNSRNLRDVLNSRVIAEKWEKLIESGSQLGKI